MDCWVVLVRRDLLWHFWSEFYLLLCYYCCYNFVLCWLIIMMWGEGMGEGTIIYLLEIMLT